MKYCRLQTIHGAQYAEVADRDGRLWIERLIPPFEEGPVSDYVDRAAGRFDPLPLDEARTLAPSILRRLSALAAIIASTPPS